MGWGEKTFKVFYWPKNPKSGEFGTRVALIVASDRAEASHKFKLQYDGQFYTIDRIEEC